MINKTLIKIGVLIASIAILATGYYGFIYVRDTLFDKETETPVSQAGPSGLLLASLGVASTSGESLGIYPMAMNIDSEEMAILPLAEVNGSEAAAIHYSNSPSDKWGVFLAQLRSDGEDALPAYSIFKADISSTNSWESLASALGGAQRVALPDEEDYFRDVPVIDDRGRVLYSSLVEENYSVLENGANDLPVEAWNIYLINEDGERTYLTNGVKPHFIGDNRVAFIRGDGVYTYDLSNNTEKLAYASPATLSFVSGLDVSSDGSQLVFTDPYSSKVRIFYVDQASGDLSLSKEVDEAASFAIFSPSSDYLAMVLLNPFSRVGYYSMNENRFLEEKELDISGETVDAIYLNDWR